MDIRATNTALTAAGFNVVLSAPTENESGTGLSTTTPTPLTEPCEFDTCPTGSPAEGFNASDTRLNWVNGFPVDAAKFGVQTLAPQFFGGPPDFVVSGPNVGTNLGTGVNGSGTVGAACEAALLGVPSAAFSGKTGGQVSFTTLTTSLTSTDSVAALVYAQLVTKFTQAILASSSRPILPPGITLNVNFPSTSGCTSASDYSFVLSRLVSVSGAVDVETCGTNSLPTETSVINTSGCFASVSVMNATDKADVGASTQQVVLTRLSGFLACLPS